MSKNLSELSGRQGLKNNLFDKLGQLSMEDGTPSKEALEKLADEFLVGKANTYGTATFYDFMKPENKGKKIYLCNGSSCMLAGTQEALNNELKKHFKPEEIGHMCCLGRCHENSSFHYNGKNYSAQDLESITKIVNKKDEFARIDHYHVESYGTQILTANPASLEGYYEVFKKALKSDPVSILEEIIKAKVRGRGGAGFPMGLKFKMCREQESTQKFIVCNADEGDPAAFTDRYLIEKQPHSVLMGMMTAGYVTGANMGVLYIRAEYPESVEAIHKALEELRSLNMLGKNILNSGFEFDFKVIKAAGAYICGEETALLSSIEGQRPEVRVRPPYPIQEGLFNKPTVVNNVETLASIPYILKNGGDKFASIGTANSSGTKLLSLDSFFNRPGVYEVDMGTPLEFVVEELGKGYKVPVKALHIGGPLGGIIPIHKIKDLKIDFGSFQDNGFLLGHASILCIPQKYPLIKYLEHLFEFTADESCGKCFPCRLGSVRGKEMLFKAQNEDYKIDRTLLMDLLETLEKGSLCALGGGMPLPVKNALEYFEEELSLYLKD